MRYKLIHPKREGSLTKTRSQAWVMGGHSAMVMVDGVAGGVLLESVKPQVGMPKATAEAIMLEIGAMFAGKHSPAALAAEFSEPCDDTPVDLSTIDPADWDDYLAWPIVPPPGVALYLAGGPFTQDEVDNMEIAIESAYGIKKPWFISSDGIEQPVVFRLHKC